MIGLYFDSRVKGSDASVIEITSPPSASPRLTPLFIGIPFESWQNIQEWPFKVWILMDIRPLYKRSPSVQTGVALNQVRWSWETSKACKLHTTCVCTDLNQQGDVVSHSSAEMTRLVFFFVFFFKIYTVYQRENIHLKGFEEMELGEKKIYL